MKVKVVRNWADASKAWIDVQTYTGLKLPPPEMQYKLSFMDKDSVPAQMIVTSDGVSWVDGLGGGYKGKTVLDMTIEEPQRGSESGGGGGGGSFVFDGAVILLGEKVVDDGETFYPVTLTLTLGGVPINTPAYVYLNLADNVGNGVARETLEIYGHEEGEGVVVVPATGGEYNYLYILFYTYNGQPDEPNLFVTLNGGSLTAQLCVLLPNGGVVLSSVMDFMASS